MTIRKITDFRLALEVQLLLKGLKTKSIASINAYLTRFNLILDRISVEDQQELAYHVYRNIKGRQLFNLEFKKGVILNPGREVNVSPPFIMEMFSSFVNDNSALINDFLKKKSMIEDSVLKGEHELALSLLDNIKSDFGPILWFLDAKFSVALINNTYDVVLDDVNSFVERHPSYRMISDVLVKKNNLNNKGFFDGYLSGVLGEYRENKYFGFVDFVVVYFSLNDDPTKISIDDLIQFSQKLGVIDRYVLYRKLLISLLSYDSSIVPEYLFRYLYSIRHSVDDHFISSTIGFVEKSSSANVSEVTQEISNLYSMEKYEEVLISVRAIGSTARFNLCCADFYARSFICLSRRPPTDYFGDEYLVENYIEKVSFSVDTLYGNLMSCMIDTSAFTSALEAIKTFALKISCFDFSHMFIPPMLAAYPFFNPGDLRRYSAQILCAGLEITPKYHHYATFTSSDANILDVNTIIYSGGMSEGRMLRRAICIELENDSIVSGEVEEMIGRLEVMANIIPSEEIYIKVKFLLKTGNIRDLLSMLVNYVVECESDYIYFPVDYIYEQCVDNSEINGSVDFIICAYIYVVYYNVNDGYIVTELLDELLSSGACLTLSELYKNRESFSKAEFYLLENVCAPNFLAPLSCFSDEESVLLERLKIIEMLIVNKSGESEHLLNAESQIYEKIAFNYFNVNHANIKINIDVDGIYVAEKSSYEYFDVLLKDIMKKIIQSPDRGLDANGLLDSKHILPFYQLYDRFIRDFLLDSELGLARYLSSEIRHGVIKSKIWSVLEAHNVVTVKVSDNVHEKDKHWSALYRNLFRSNVISSMQEHLMAFSKSVDKELDKITAMASISVDGSSKDVAFDLAFGVGEVRVFHKYYTEMYETKSLFEICKDYVWLVLENCFSEMKRRINESFKASLNSSFDILLKQVSAIEGRVDMVQLRTAIVDARRDSLDALSQVESWFCKPTDKQASEISLNEIIHYSTMSFVRFFLPKIINIEEVIEHDDVLFVSNEHVSDIWRGMFTCFSNALAHGFVKNGRNARVTIKSIDNCTVISVDNFVTSEKIKEIADKKVFEKFERFKTDPDNKLLVLEGGSGLYKSYRYITDVSDRFSFDIFLNGNVFSQVIKYSRGASDEGINC